MKCVLVHSHRFLKCNHKFYSPNGGLGPDVLNFYLAFADQLTIIARIEDTKNVGNRQAIDDERIAIFDYRQLSSKQIESMLVDSELLVVRTPCLIATRVARMAKNLKRPYLAEVVACAHDIYSGHSIKGKLVAPFGEHNEACLVKNAAFVLYVTKEYLQRKYPTNGRTIACSDVRLEKMSADIVEKRINQIESKSMMASFKIGTCGNLDVPHKGQEFVIEALAGIKSVYPEIEFKYELVGSGSPERLIKIAEQCGIGKEICIKGRLSHDEVFSWLDGLDIYIQPSTNEGLPRALVEAMSRAVPSLGSKVGGIPELLGPKEMFEVGDVTGISNCITRLMNEVQRINLAHEMFDTAKRYDRDLLDSLRFDFYSSYSDFTKAYYSGEREKRFV